MSEGDHRGGWIIHTTMSSCPQTPLCTRIRTNPKPLDPVRTSFFLLSDMVLSVVTPQCEQSPMHAGDLRNSQRMQANLMAVVIQIGSFRCSYVVRLTVLLRSVILGMYDSPQDCSSGFRKRKSFQDNALNVSLSLTCVYYPQCIHDDCCCSKETNPQSQTIRKFHDISNTTVSAFVFPWWRIATETDISVMAVSFTRNSQSPTVDARNPPTKQLEPR